MAEALAVVGVVSSIVGLVDFSSKVLHRLNEFQSSRGEIPESFRHIKEKLPILLETLNQTKLAVEKGSIKEETKEALSSVVDGCQTQITLLNDLIGKSLPQESDSWRKKTASKVISSLRRDAKVTKITATLRMHMYSGLDKLPPLRLVSIADCKRYDCLVADMIDLKQRWKNYL